MVALAGALAAGPGLLRRNLANLRLALPVALIASTFSIIGAMLGLYLSSLNPDIIQICLGVTIVGIAILLLVSKNTEKPVVNRQDAIGLALGLRGPIGTMAHAKVCNGKPIALYWACVCLYSSVCWPACSDWARDGPMCRCSTC